MICGIVDLGSNTIRLSIYHWEGQDFRLLLNKKTMAGLTGYVQGGVLSDSGILVACRTLSSYRALLDNFQVSKMHVFATASLRNISNTGEAVETIRDVTGIPVEVLSGDAEAALSFKGAVLPGGVSTGLLADIGGGSFELVSYEDMSITSACSLPVGSLSLYTRFVNGLFPTPEERKAMRAYVEEQLDRARTAGVRRSRLCGVGGTIRALNKLSVDVFHKPPESRSMTAEELRELYKLLKKDGRDTLRQILHAAPDRVHTLVPGLVILNTIIKAYGVEQVTASSSGVREGYLMDRVMKL
ncbi:phosphatase [Intestinimonas butyriciproducens]|uniref:Ppx/GppA phosphatase family protein n=1 Tax=Intestinimonas butyriciproducens TaxID=1297617 RepID=UPI001D06B56D|nr:phosphatase [Intestinimonas butyriciproducens]MCB7049665.1 phosphatase [Intestinimonas butyriciproducens]